MSSSWINKVKLHVPSMTGQAHILEHVKMALQEAREEEREKIGGIWEGMTHSERKHINPTNTN